MVRGREQTLKCCGLDVEGLTAERTLLRALLVDFVAMVYVCAMVLEESLQKKPTDATRSR